MPTSLVEHNATPAKPGFVLTGRMVLVTLVLFFVVIATVNAIMMTLAIRTMPGTVTPSAYQASQKFNQSLADARARDAKGWKVDARVAREGGMAAIRVDVADVSGLATDALLVKAHLVRPAFMGQQAPVILTQVTPHQFMGKQSLEGSGAFDLLLEIRAGGETLYRSSNRIMLP